MTIPERWKMISKPNGFVYRTPVFALQSPSLKWVDERDRTKLVFNAGGERLLKDASLEIDNLPALLLSSDHQVVGTRDVQYSSRKFVGSKCTWSHEFTNGQRKRATSVVYLLELKVDYRSKLLSGTVAPFSIGGEQAMHIETTSNPSDHPLFKTTLELRIRGTDLEYAIGCLAHGNHTYSSVSASIEFNSSDNVLALATNSRSVSFRGDNPFGLSESSIVVDRETAESIRSFEMIGRTELRLIHEIGPLALPES